MDLVGTVLAFALRVARVSQEALDLQDQQVLRDHPAHKDPRVHKETKVTMAKKEARAL